MKKIAFYVEGLTEQLFINKLLIEIAGRKNIEIELSQFQGNGKAKKIIYHKVASRLINPKYHALIFDCVGDGGVKTRIIQDYQQLFSHGYSEIIGLLDLYPKSDLIKFENELINGYMKKNGQVLIPPLPHNTSIIIAVNEVESWFLSECTHFECIDISLTNSLITSSIGFNPCTDDMTLRTRPAQDLHEIYQLANKEYMSSNGRKRKNKIEKTVECLDYANIYITLRNRITKLNELISKIDTFLT